MSFLSKKALLFLFVFSVLFNSGCTPTSQSILDLSVLDLEGNEVDLNTFNGKPVVVNFWATWCPPCRAEKPELDKARQILEQEGVAFVCLSDENLNTIQTYLRHQPNGLTNFKLKSSAKWLGVFEYPQTFLINTQGEIVHTHTGYNQWSNPETLELIREKLR
ncbi:MAG: TlpA family protein disulfide reductase [Sphingobacteriales bacterium]|nr:MAG: TlpA family protein disulfide reductase [Sphingobacteriales bacterium]